MAGVTMSEGRGPVLLGITWTWTAIATLLYFTRAKNASIAPKEHRSLYGLRWDFVWVTIAYVTALCAQAFLTVSVHYGTGNHQYLLSPTQAINSAFWSWIGQICAIFALVWGRFSVIAFLVALQGRTYLHWKRFLYVIGTLQFLINSIEVVLILNQCQPTRRLWDESVSGTCPLILTCSKVGYFQGSVGAFADLSLALYPPAVIIGPLQAMSRRLKIGLCVVMGGGVVAGVAGIVKTISIEGILKTSDISYATINLLIMVMTEVWFIIIFGSLPALHSTFISASRHLASVTGRTRGSNKSSSYPRHDNAASWVELSGKAYSYQPDERSPQRGYVKSNGMRNTSAVLGRGDSEEEILAVPERGVDGIVVTTRTTVVATPA